MRELEPQLIAPTEKEQGRDATPRRDAANDDEDAASGHRALRLAFSAQRLDPLRA